MCALRVCTPVPHARSTVCAGLHSRPTHRRGGILVTGQLGETLSLQRAPEPREGEREGKRERETGTACVRGERGG